jgi:protein TonB
MSGYTAAMPLSWAFATEVDAHFRRILRINLAAFLLLAIVIPLLPLSTINKRAEPEDPPRVAKLLFEKKLEPPRPAPEVRKPQQLPEKTVKAQPIKQPPKVSKPVPKPVKKVPTAKQQAEQAGLLALKDTLSDLRQNTVATNLKVSRNLSHSGGQARKSERAVLTAGTASGSGGIKTASLSRNTGGGQLSSRSTTRVHSPLGNAAGSGAGDKHGNSPVAGRSIEEIQMVFDRNKGSIYNVYNRALRKNRGLQGKIVLRLTIAPSGKVTLCELVSSELQDPVLGQKITQRVKLFDFGAKDVSEVTITYPIDFLPA